VINIPAPEHQMPGITVIIAVYNGEKFLQQCIDSVADQTYTQKQIIVIDGGSRDSTVKIIHANQEKLDYWVSEPDKGIYDAWNKGLKQATGDWVLFIGADDYLTDQGVFKKLSLQLSDVPEDIKVAYGQIMIIDAMDKALYALGSAWENLKNRFQQLMCLPHPAVVHRRSLFTLHGTFDDSFRIAGDYELLLRELKAGDAQFLPGIVVTAMRQGGISSNPGNNLIALQEVRRAQIKNEVPTLKLYWLIAIVRAHLGIFLFKLFGAKFTRRLLNTVRSAMISMRLY
jgi:glycosyltransferase involved in cell wall biosynthesis